MLPKLTAAFFAQPGSDPPSQPVRDWLLRLTKAERTEVRTSLNTRIARVIFAVEGNTMYLLHGFIKTTQKTPPADLALAQKRWKQIKPL